MHVTSLHRPLRKDDTPLDGGSSNASEERTEESCLEVGRRVLRMMETKSQRRLRCLNSEMCECSVPEEWMVYHHGDADSDSTSS